MTRHLRAQYVEATLQRTEMSNDEVSVHKDLRTSQIQNSEQYVKRMIAAISGFTNPFCFNVNPNELYCLSSGVPAKSDVADDLLKAPDILKRNGKLETFVKKRLVDKTMSFHDPIKRNK